MTQEATAGVSKRSLVMLGGLAALALNADLRRSLVRGSKQAWSGAHHTLDDTLKPGLHQVARQGLERLGHLKEELGHLTEENVPKVQTLLGEAAHTAQGLAAQVQDRSGDWSKEARKLTRQGRQEAARALAAARVKSAATLAGASESGLGWLGEVQERVQEVLGERGDSLEARRHRAERRLTQARRQAERELLASQEHWNPRKLDKAVTKKVAPLHRELGRELKVLEKQARLARRSDRRSAGSLSVPLLLGAGVVVLARMPQAREAIVKQVEGVSPEAAEKLREASRQVRNVVGSVWLEAAEPHAAAAQAAPTDSAKGQTDTSAADKTSTTDKPGAEAQKGAAHSSGTTKA